MYHEYISVQIKSGAAISPHAFIGNGPPYMVGRVSYSFGLLGPCVSTDTACSSSLVATHLAHRGIVSSELQAGLAGGINIMLSCNTTAGICQLQVRGLPQYDFLLGYQGILAHHALIQSCYYDDFDGNKTMIALHMYRPFRLLAVAVPLTCKGTVMGEEKDLQWQCYIRLTIPRRLPYQVLPLCAVLP